MNLIRSMAGMRLHAKVIFPEVRWREEHRGSLLGLAHILRTMFRVPVG